MVLTRRQAQVVGEGPPAEKASSQKSSKARASLKQKAPTTPRRNKRNIATAITPTTTSITTMATPTTPIAATLPVPETPHHLLRKGINGKSIVDGSSPPTPAKNTRSQIKKRVFDTGEEEEADSPRKKQSIKFCGQEFEVKVKPLSKGEKKQYVKVEEEEDEVKPLSARKRKQYSWMESDLKGWLGANDRGWTELKTVGVRMHGVET